MVILGVSNDKPDKNLKFRQKHEFPYDLLSDEGNQVALAYGAVEDPQAKSHKRISYIIGPDGVIQKVYGSVKAAEHPERVLGDLAG